VIREVLGDFARVICALPYVEWGRRFRGPAPLASTLRRRGAKAVARDAERRNLLRKVIGAVDSRLPGGANCYRRALLEIGLDAGAAREPLHLGLRSHGGPQSGHAWLGSAETSTEVYDARFEI
jgi:hypothetical protein